MCWRLRSRSRSASARSNLQPFKIPTSSMQPTPLRHPLCGPERSGSIRRTDLRNHAAALLPAGKTGNSGRRRPDRLQHAQQTSVRNGNLASDRKPGLFSSGNHRQCRALCESPAGGYRKGELLCDGYLSTGDHLFVDRFSIHFLPPKRGDVIVFTTENIHSPTQPLGGYYYIKRLVGLPGDTLKIVDNILYIKPEGETEFKPATAFSDKFRRLYSFEGGYQGHIASNCWRPAWNSRSRKTSFSRSATTPPTVSTVATGDSFPGKTSSDGVSTYSGRSPAAGDSSTQNPSSKEKPFCRTQWLCNKERKKS